MSKLDSAGQQQRETRTARFASVWIAVLLGAVLAVCVGVAGAAPLGQITEFTAPGSNPAQVVAGPDGNLWFSDRNGAVGRITTGGTVTEFTSGLNPGSAVRSIAMGPDGNMWFSDPGTTRAIGMIDPTTHAISEFSSGLNAGSMPLGIAAGPDGNVWFTDSGTTKAIGMINPTTHAISEFSSGLNAGSNLQQGLVAGPDGNLWFTDQGVRSASSASD
jgi:streptogramin lyase